MLPNLQRLSVRCGGGGGGGGGGFVSTGAWLKDAQWGAQQCAICASPLSEDTDNAENKWPASGGYFLVTACLTGHVYHKGCLKEWVRANEFDTPCPECRKPIFAEVKRDLQRETPEEKAARAAAAAAARAATLTRDEEWAEAERAEAAAAVARADAAAAAARAVAARSHPGDDDAAWDARARAAREARWSVEWDARLERERREFRQQRIRNEERQRRENETPIDELTPEAYSRRRHLRADGRIVYQMDPASVHY